MPHGVNTEAKKFFSNVAYAFLAQGISLLLSLVMSLIVPKLLGVREFSYWQLFLFYTNYTGALTFGFNSGLYLRFGGKNYSELDHTLLGNQLRIFAAFQILLAVSMAFLAVSFERDPARKFVWICVAAQLLLTNTKEFFDCVFQAVNRTKYYSISVMVNKSFFLVAAVLLVVFGVRNFQPYVAFFLTGILISTLYSFRVGRKMIFAPGCSLKRAVGELWKNIRIGMNLMLSNLSDILILGIARFVVEAFWGLEVFGKLSFSISLENFFLLFIGQVSMVLFPALRQTDSVKLKRIYGLGHDLLGVVMQGILLLYLPIQYLLGLWLPQYRDSLRYLALLLPICVFDGKMQLLFATYLKVLRKERMLLAVNLLCCGISMVLCFASGYLFHNLLAVILSMVAAIAVRSIVSDLFLSRIIGIHAAGSILNELVLNAIFMAGAWLLSPLKGFLVYFVAYGLFLVLHRNQIMEAGRKAKHGLTG